MISDKNQKKEDKRQYYLKNKLSEDGYLTLIAGEVSAEKLSVFQSDSSSPPLILLLPVPADRSLLSAVKLSLSKNMIILGGGLPADFTDFCTETGIPYIDYMHSDTVALKNAVATAEGIIAHAIMSTPKNLHGSHALIIGYGKCGEILAEKLNALHTDVSVQTRNTFSQAKAESYGYRLHKDTDYPEYDLIFNTAPALTLTQDILDRLNPDVTIFDIASFPGGTDFDYCASKGIKASLYPGLPGKIAPEASAQIIYEYVKPKLQKMMM